MRIVTGCGSSEWFQQVHEADASCARECPRDESFATLPLMTCHVLVRFCKPPPRAFPTPHVAIWPGAFGRDIWGHSFNLLAVVLYPSTRCSCPIGVGQLQLGAHIHKPHTHTLFAFTRLRTKFCGAIFKQNSEPFPRTNSEVHFSSGV